MTSTSPRGGRPSDYTPEKAAEICAEIACGKSVREICRSDDMPAMPTVFRWLAAHEDFARLYAQARQAQADYLAEEMLEIADDASNDWMSRQRKDGSVEKVPDNETVNRSRVRIDTRKWLLAKVHPKKYGDKLSTEVSGPDGAPLTIAREEIRNLSDAAIDAIIEGVASIVENESGAGEDGDDDGAPGARRGRA